MIAVILKQKNWISSALPKLVILPALVMGTTKTSNQNACRQDLAAQL
jgi:hypothetical protein